MLNRKSVTLYFIAGIAPTIAEQEDAAQYGRVAFRNASRIVRGDPPEPCDFVAGLTLIPVAYKDIPRAEVLTPVQQKVEAAQGKRPHPLETSPGLGKAPTPGRKSGAKQTTPPKGDGWGNA